VQTHGFRFFLAASFPQTDKLVPVADTERAVEALRQLSAASRKS